MGTLQYPTLTFVGMLVLAYTVAGHSDQSHDSPKYPECRQGEEYALHARRKDIPDEDLQYYHIRKKNGRERYYLCRLCSMCGDGIEEISPCWNSQDTKCGGCIDPEYMYDKATKSCQPKSKIQGYTDVPPNTQTDYKPTHAQDVLPKPEEEIDGDKDAIDIKNGEQSLESKYDLNKGNEQMAVEDAENIGVGKQKQKEMDHINTPHLVVVVVSSVLVAVLLVAIVVVVYVSRRRKTQTARTPTSV
ncbi:uncharacterized protein LOC144447995 [Glandiceps talaboti]